MSINFPNRLEIRIDSDTSKKLDAYCNQNRKKQSEVIRDAIESFLATNSFKTLILTQIDSKEDFRQVLRTFISESPPQVSKFFDDLIGSEEESRAAMIPYIKGIEDLFITERGRKAFKKRK